MSLRSFIATFLFWCLTINSSFGQLIADFNFRDNASLKTNDAGEDAFYINSFARSNGEGVYTVKDPSKAPDHPDNRQNIELRVSEDLLSGTESIYMEFDYQNEDSFGWLIFSGDELHFGIAHLESEGFKVRYYTKAEPDAVIESNFIPHSLARGERAIITFIYSKEEGTAYLFKNETEIWRTPEARRTPGYALHWFTQEGHFTIASHMGGEESDAPSLYFFRAYEEPCPEINAPSVLNDTICGPASAILSSSGGENGNYRWYESESAAEPITHYDSSFTTPELSQTTSYYVSLAKGPCESNRVKVTAHVNLPPSPPDVRDESRCGPGKLTLTATGGNNGAYRWYQGSSDTRPIPGAVNSTFETDFLDSSQAYYVAIAGENCESERRRIDAIILQQPEPPQSQSLSRCGPGKVEVQVFSPGNLHSSGFRLYRQRDDASPSYEQNSSILEVTVEKDTVLYVSVTNGDCESGKEPVYIRVLPFPEIDAGEDLTILKGESVQLKAEGMFTSVHWEPTQSMDFPNTETPTVSPDYSTSYIVTALNENNCEKRDTVQVIIIEKFPAPNAFSPNNDGINDFWEIPTIDQYPNCKLLIFNRWGNQIFSSKGYQQPWDGTFNGKKLPAGTYYYTLQLSPDHELEKGSVFLMR